MLYKEVEMALGINSFYSKTRLASHNIKVRFGAVYILMWSPVLWLMSGSIV